MHYFDKERKRLGGDDGGWPVMRNSNYILPRLHVDPEEFDIEGQIIQWSVMVMVPTERRASFTQIEAKFTTLAKLTAFLEQWLADPERALLDTFNYTVVTKDREWQDEPTAAVKNEAEDLLSDLGLL